MKSLLSMLIVFCFLFVQIARIEAQPRTGKGSQRASSAKNVEAAIPSAELKTVESPDEVVWDFILWTDSTNKHHLCAKPLSLDGKNVHMTRKDGSLINIPVDRFSKQDQELLSQAYSAEKRKTLLAEREAFHDAVKRALETFPGETSIKQAELREDREKEFLQAYDGTEFYFVFPIVDISPSRSATGLMIPVFERDNRAEAAAGNRFVFKADCAIFVLVTRVIYLFGILGFFVLFLVSRL